MSKFPSVIHRADAALQVYRGVGTSSSISEALDLSDQIIADYLRKTICSLTTSFQSMDSSEPVYVRRLTNRVRRQLSPIWQDLHYSRNAQPSRRDMEREGDTQPDPIRRVLIALNDLGDLSELRHGYWLPSPVRLVELPISGRILVLGGLATQDLGELLSPRIQMPHWISRIIEKDKLPKNVQEDQDYWQSLENWLGETVVDLESWTRSRLTEAEENLAQSGSSFRDFEVYSPKLKQREPQFFRWVWSRELRKCPEETVLCRYRFGVGGPRNYLLGKLTNSESEIVLDREFAVQPYDVRRLQYGLDLLAGAPTAAKVKHIGSECELTLRSWVPPEERRLLLALARETSKTPGRLPLKFTFSVTGAQDIIEKIRMLGVTVDGFREDDGGGLHE